MVVERMNLGHRGRGLVPTRYFNLSKLIKNLKRVELIKTVDIEHGLLLGLKAFRNELDGIKAHRYHNFSKLGLRIQGLVVNGIYDGRFLSTRRSRARNHKILELVRDRERGQLVEQRNGSRRV